MYHLHNLELSTAPADHLFETSLQYHVTIFGRNVIGHHLSDRPENKCKSDSRYQFRLDRSHICLYRLTLANKQQAQTISYASSLTPVLQLLASGTGLADASALAEALCNTRHLGSHTGRYDCFGLGVRESGEYHIKPCFPARSSAPYFNVSNVRERQ